MYFTKAEIEAMQKGEIKIYIEKMSKEDDNGGFDMVY